MRRIVAAVALILGTVACGGPSAPPAGSLPASDHVHALRTAGDGSLLLGLHGALWRRDDGEAWEPLGLEGQDAMALGVAEHGQPLLVGGHDVLARSTDGGTTFEMLSPQLPSRDVHALAQAPSDPKVVYAYIVGAGVYRSVDAGDTWTAEAAVGKQLPGDLAAMAVDPTDPDIVLAGSGGNGVFRSSDGGTSFVRTTDWGSFGLAFAADGTVLAATRQGVDVSEDGGITWDTAAPADVFDGQPLAVAIATDGTWWVVTETPRVLYRNSGSGFHEVARA